MTPIPWIGIGPTATSFSPLSLSPVGWWKGDTITGADQAQLLTWLDSSGNGFNLAATSGHEPIVEASERNGKNAARFVGAAVEGTLGYDKLSSTGAALVNVAKNTDQPCTIYYAFNHGSSGYGTVASWGAASALGPYMGSQTLNDDDAVLDGKGDVRFFKADNVGSDTTLQTTGTPGYVIGNWSQVTVKHTGTTTTIYIDGATSSVSAAAQDKGSMSNIDRFAVGVLSRGDDSTFPSGNTGLIGEIVVFNTAHSDTDRQNMESYLRERWITTGATDAGTNPSTLSGYAYHYKDLGLSGADAAAITTWTKTAGTDATQSNASFKPTIKRFTNGINFLTAARFDGSDDFLSIASSATLSPSSSSQGITVFAVVRPNTVAAGGKTIVGKNRADSLAYEWYLWQSGTTVGVNYYQAGGANYAAVNSPGSFALDTPAIAITRLAYGVKASLWLNGGAGVSTTSFTGSMTADTGLAYIGQRGDSQQYFSGDIAEVVIFNTPLSEANLNAVLKWYGSRANITTSTLVL